jgi:hypothetical protein
MTPRERVLAVLRHEAVDRVPWFGDLDYWATSLIHRGERPAGFTESSDYLAWHRELGVGFYLQGWFPMKLGVTGGDVGDRDDGVKRERTIHTPKGTLRERWEWSAQTFSWAPEERLVKSIDDLRIYRWVAEHADWSADYAYAARRGPQIGDQGVLLGYLHHSPLMQMVALDAGIEFVAVTDADDPDLLASTLAAWAEALVPAQRIAIESPAEVLMIPDNLSSEVVGTRLFERYLRPYYETWTPRVRDAGKPSCVHLDGTLRGLLAQVGGCGFTFVEAMTPAPVGDVPVSAWPSFRGGSDVVYWGGIPGAYFSPVVSDAEFERHVRETLSVMRADRRMVLGVADQVPPDALERRVRRVADLVDEQGRYGSPPQGRYD